MKMRALLCTVLAAIILPAFKVSRTTRKVPFAIPLGSEFKSLGRRPTLMNYCMVRTGAASPWVGGHHGSDVHGEGIWARAIAGNLWLPLSLIFDSSDGSLPHLSFVSQVKCLDNLVMDDVSKIDWSLLTCKGFFCKAENVVIIVDEEGYVLTQRSWR